jgi:hypothetical protein
MLAGQEAQVSFTLEAEILKYHKVLVILTDNVDLLFTIFLSRVLLILFVIVFVTG